MIRFAQTCQAISLRSARLEKLAILAEYLRTLDDPDLEAAARFFTGNPFAARDPRSLALGGRSIARAAENVWSYSGPELRNAYRETGDLGDALGRLVRPVHDLGLFTETLTPAHLATLFEAIAAATGKNAGKTREQLCERILRACSDPLEVTYVVKVMTGDLRIGLREGLVLDAIAEAFGAEPAAVRRGNMASGDVGAVAVAARIGKLDALHVSYGAPIGFMLASPVPYGDAYPDLADKEWFVEDKYDGIRVQAHVRDGTVRLFSRTLNDVTRSYPEIAAALSTLHSSAILDGEIVAKRDGRVLPFRYLQARLQRKDVSEKLLRDVPLAYVAFDLLAVGDEFLIDTPLMERRDRLASLVGAGTQIEIAPLERLAEARIAADVNVLFDKARERGNEGLVLKRTDAPYLPGRRGRWWLKLKQELSTLDVVVVAVEWGHGKRAKVLSDYTFAVRATDGGLLTIGKAYSGLTDAEIADLTQWFLAHRTGARRGHAMDVEPTIVLEIAFDIIQKSALHESGFSLRFPRIVRIRDDKPPSDIDTIERAAEIHREMLSREGVEDR